MMFALQSQTSKQEASQPKQVTSFGSRLNKLADTASQPFITQSGVTFTTSLEAIQKAGF